MSCRSIGALFGLLLLVAPRISADEVPLRNWTVPSSPTRLSALGDIGNPGVFVVDLVHHGAILKHLDFAGFLAELNLDFPAVAVFFSDSGTNSLFNGVDQQGPINPLVPADLIDNSF